MRYIVNSAHAGYAVNTAARQGISPAQLCQAAGVDLEKTQNPESFITYRQYHNLISQGVQISGNTYFWLTRLYQELKGHSNPFMMYCLNAHTLQEAVSRHKNNYPVINTGLDVVFEHREGYYILRRQTRSPDLELSEAMADWGFSQWYHLVELFTGPVGALKGINMVSDSVPRKKKYEEYFGVPVKANSTANELLYSQNADQLPNSRGVFDPNLDTVLQPLLDKMLSAMDNPSTLEENLLRAVQKVLMDGPPR